MSLFDIVSILIVTIFLGLWFAIARLERRKDLQKQRESRENLEKVKGWKCTECQQVLGDDALIVFYGGGTAPVEIDGELFDRWVNVVCPHCQMIRCRNQNGDPWSIPGELHDPDLFSEDENGKK
jgi:hypothetical protein